MESSARTKTTILNRPQKTLLLEVLQKNGVVGDYEGRILNAEEIHQIQEMLSDELCETGLLDNDEPNARGLLLEELIDVVGHAAEEKQPVI